MKKTQPNKKQELSEEEMKAVAGGAARRKLVRRLREPVSKSGTTVELTDAELSAAAGGTGKMAPRKKR